MSFDRLTAAKRGVLYSCVRQTAGGYRVVSVPPYLTIVNGDEETALTIGRVDTLS